MTPWRRRASEQVKGSSVRRRASEQAEGSSERRRASEQAKGSSVRRRASEQVKGSSEATMTSWRWIVSGMMNGEAKGTCWGSPIP